MPRLPLRDLIVHKARPLLTLELTNAALELPEETVETYIFTETILNHFTAVLETVALGRGQGFWVEAEYGSGKTHFLATLTALLSDFSDSLWSKVGDNTVRQYQTRLRNHRLFPVILSLRGEASAEATNSRSLMDVLLEKGFLPALKRVGLEKRVHLTMAQDLIRWYEERSASDKASIDTYIRQKTGNSVSGLMEDDNQETIAQHLNAYLAERQVQALIPTSVKARLAGIYSQIIAQGYAGILIIIDEYEGWANIHANNPEARAKDEDLLETLGYLLFKESGMAIHTIIASQSTRPTKLKGGQEGDRFINLALLASQDERDYDIIASRRVRSLNPQCYPEISDYYRFYQQSFDFTRHLTEDEFKETYPFQPRCFEIVRRITSRDLPGPRSGILILYEILQNQELLARDTLIRASDLIFSEHLLKGCLNTPIYKPHFIAYKNAMQALPNLDMGDDIELAKNLLTTLYLWYEANFDRPHTLSIKELTEATLLVDNVLKAEDNVLLVLNDLNALPWIHLEGENARFIPSEDIVLPSNFFKEYVRKVQQGDRYAVISTWNDSLFWKTLFTTSRPGMFSDLEPDRPVNRAIEVHNLQYSGEIIIATRWQADWGMQLVADDQHYRIVIMVADVAQRVKPEELQDPRIAVIYPAILSEEANHAATEYLAWYRMSEDYKNRTGKDAETIQGWLATQKSIYINNLLQTQLWLYRNGTVTTRDNLGIATREIFSKVGFEGQISLLTEKILSACYKQPLFDWGLLHSTLTATEAGKLFEGYFSKSPGPAQMTATKNYGIGLGLSTSAQPTQFAPQKSAQALEVISELLTAEKDNELKVYKICEALSRPPYGLPYVVIQIYLLSFLRRGNPRVELSLKPNHKIRTRDNRPLPQNRINAATITDLQWKPDLWPSLDSLIPAVGPHWNDVLDYGRLIVDDLRATVVQTEIEVESKRLLERLQRASEELTTHEGTLQVLQRTLGADIPKQDQEILANLKTLFETRASHETFYEKAVELFQSPDTLKSAMQAYGRLKELSGLTAQIGEVQKYLQFLSVRDNERELKAQRTTLQTRLDLPSLAAQPHLWGGIQATFDDFKKRYRNEYQKFHRDTNAALSKIKKDLTDTDAGLNALALLNTINELGQAVGDNLKNRYDEMIHGLEPCPVINYLEVTVDAKPVCASCNREMTYTAPIQAVEELTSDLEQALLVQQRRLASETTRRVLEHGKGDALSQFLQVIQAANIASLVDVLDEKIVRMIRKLLTQEQVVTIESEAVSSLLKKYGSLEETDIPAVVEEFKTLLQKAFKDAKHKNPKKNIRINLK
jgi:Skp family chaperone for outer membrane proteins